MEWQRYVADLALEHDDGLLVYRDIDLSIGRQMGKSTTVLALVVYRMLSAPGQWLIYAAQSRLAARRKLLDVWWPRLRRSPLRDLFTISKGTGMEALRSHNGSILTLLSEDETSGHGDSIDLVVLDECWSQTEAAEAAVVPAMITRPNAQIWRLSTAGTLKSVYWRSRVDAGRLAAGMGLSDGTAFVEWAADPDDDPTSPATWRRCMPALGITIDEATVTKTLASMGLTRFKRAGLNLWPDESDLGWLGPIKADVWAAARL
jgi:phage terminase large subunit-like protein